MMRM
jgi:hypothetical protein